MKRLCELLLLFLLTLFFVACNSDDSKKSKSQVQEVPETDSVKTEIVEQIHRKLSPLINNEVIFTDKDFGDIIELKGTSCPVEQVFSIRETEMIALDSVLIVKNSNEGNMFMAYTLPDFRFIKSFGRSGGGPGEFQFPGLVKDESGEFLCLIHEKARDRMYSLSKDFEIKELDVSLQAGNKRFSDKQLYAISPNDFMYVESVRGGKAVFETKVIDDSTSTELLKKLAFSDDHKSWAAYIGDFGVSAHNKRFVFAYKYFKRLVFNDYENNTSKVVTFDLPESMNHKRGESMMSPSNVTHYWGMSSNEQHVYVLYSGRTPIQVSEENKQTSGYIFVEKYDWNGNPVGKFKLDNWGYFCVNQAENTIIVASTTEDQPFFKYHLP